LKLETLVWAVQLTYEISDLAVTMSTGKILLALAAVGASVVSG